VDDFPAIRACGTSGFFFLRNRSHSNRVTVAPDQAIGSLEYDVPAFMLLLTLLPRCILYGVIIVPPLFRYRHW
jgi:hypothetical protein